MPNNKSLLVTALLASPLASNILAIIRSTTPNFLTLAGLEIQIGKVKVKVEISGHTSCIGGTNHNLRLSSKRSEAVKKFLSLNGIADDRIETVGFGAQFPIASNETEAGQKENRRVEFKILAK